MFDIKTTEIIKILVKNGADIELISNIHNLIPLELAILSNKLENVKTLIELGANINFQNTMKYNSTPLHFAIRKERKNIAKLLILSGARTNIVDNNNKLASEYNPKMYNEIMTELSEAN
jgi:ankyrin repeat protein